MEICQHNLPSIRIGVKEICAGQMLSDSVSHVFWSRDSGDGQSTKSDKSQTYLPAHNHDVKLGDFDDREWFVFRFPLKKSCVRRHRNAVSAVNVASFLLRLSSVQRSTRVIVIPQTFHFMSSILY